MRLQGPDALAVCRAHRGLPVGFLLLRYSVLFTVESLFLLYLLVISWLICFRRWCIDKLEVFHANQISMRLDPHLNQGWGWRQFNQLKPSSEIFTDRSKAVHLLWLFYVFFWLAFTLSLCASVYMCCVVTCWERGTSWLSFVVSTYEFVTFPLVSWVRCGTSLYRFLSFASLLTSIPIYFNVYRH